MQIINIFISKYKYTILKFAWGFEISKNMHNSANLKDFVICSFCKEGQEYKKKYKTKQKI